jgi:hypothetical protein
LTYILGDINNDSLGSSGGFASFLRHEGPDLVEVDGGFEILISLEVEVTLAGFTEVTGVAIAGKKKGVLITTFNTTHNFLIRFTRLTLQALYPLKGLVEV